MNSCNVKISIGELYDKFSILQIKKEKINDTDKLTYINKEIENLNPLIDNFKLDHQILKHLIIVNQKLWEIEDKIRIKERMSEFDNEFIQLARSVYITNDERYTIKKQIDNIFNSEIKEIKSYV